MSFADSLAKYCQAAGEQIDTVVRKTAFELQASMIEKSPVDTGRFKSNWQVGISAINVNTNSSAGSDALGRVTTALQGYKPGNTIWLTNSLPYAKRLENGWSKQAPAGIVRLTLQDFHQAVERAVKGIK